jgi:hypothetical protein
MHARIGKRNTVASRLVWVYSQSMTENGTRPVSLDTDYAGDVHELSDGRRVRCLGVDLGSRTFVAKTKAGYLRYTAKDIACLVMD